MLKTKSINGKDPDEVWAALKAEFPQSAIENHPATRMDYVPAAKIEERLNEVLGTENWNFYLTSEPRIYKLGENDFESCVVSGKLVIYDDDRTEIVRSTGGAADLIYPKDSDRPTSVANTVDSAVQDAFKRCAKRFGIAKLENKSGNSGRNASESRKKAESQLMKVMVLEPFKALPRGGVKVKVSYNEKTFELIIWQKDWEKLQKSFAQTFKVGNKLNEITFYGTEGEYKGEKQLIFTSLPKKGAA